jgi:hypothetical protein
MEATLHKVACSFVEWFSAKVFMSSVKPMAEVYTMHKDLTGFFFPHDSHRVLWNSNEK